MRIAILDIETTARFPDMGTIVEVGICLLDLETRFKSKLFDGVCRESNFHQLFEGANLSQCWVFQNSSLKLHEVETAAPWEEVKPKIQKILDKFPVTAFNTDFDFGFLKSRGIRISKPLPCPMKAATPVLKIPGKYGDYKWPSVEESWRYFFPDQTGFIESHRAYDDALHEADIVHALYQKGAWIPNILQFN